MCDRELVDEIVLTDTDDICVAIKDIFEDTRSITEPSGALAVAGIYIYIYVYIYIYIYIYVYVYVYIYIYI